MTDAAPVVVELVSMREAARRLTGEGYRIDESTIRRQVKAGTIPNRGTPDRPLVTVDDVRNSRSGNVDARKRRGAPMAAADAGASGEGGAGPAAAAAAPPAGSLHQSRLAKESVQAQLAQLQLEDKLGRTIDKAEVWDLFAELGTMLRDEQAARLDVLAARCHGLEPGAIRDAIADADRQLLLKLHAKISADLDPQGVNSAAA
jgi:hypothetical protein